MIKDMNNLLILGAGGHGMVVAELALLSGLYRNIAFLDDHIKNRSTTQLGQKIIGEFNSFNDNKLKLEYQEAIVAIGDSGMRVLKTKELIKEGFKVPILKHPTSSISPNSSIERGCVFMANSSIQAGCEIGLSCIINTSASFDHFGVMEEGVHLCPGVHVAGNVHIGQNTWIGIGSSVIQNIKIGDLVTVGAGSVVINDLENNNTYFGIPAKKK
tara:strand:+ start:30880 stop:31521 length:642 start_codon:yes stop_codon:yes gene_type:complete